MAVAAVKSHWWNVLLFAAAAGVIFSLLPRHEPWFDEAQGWLLARDAGVKDLIFKYMRYEGQPGLWHLILVLPAKLGLPYKSANVISGLAALAGLAVFLRFAPLPWPLKVLVPFTYFAVYQYAVIARSYALVPLLLYLTAAIYPTRLARPYLWAGLMILLSHSTLHGALIAIALYAVYAFDVAKSWRTGKEGRASSAPTGGGGAFGGGGAARRRAQVIAAGAFAASLAFIVLQLWPPSDLTFAPGWIFSPKEVAIKSISMMTHAMTRQVFVAAAVVAVSAWWFLRRGVFLAYALPTAALLALFGVKWGNLWHEGLLFFVWVFALWLSFIPTGGTGGTGPSEVQGTLDLPERGIRRLMAAAGAIAARAARPAMVAAALVVCLIQVRWAGASLFADYYNAYSAGGEVAAYIKARRIEGERIYMTGCHSVGILPYFQKNIFANYNSGRPPCFWRWSTANATGKDLDGVLAGRPDVIIMGLKFPRDEETYRRMQWMIMRRGLRYRFVARFDARLVWKTGLGEKDSFAVFERNPSRDYFGRRTYVCQSLIRALGGLRSRCRLFAAGTAGDAEGAKASSSAARPDRQQER